MEILARVIQYPSEIENVIKSSKELMAESRRVAAVQPLLQNLAHVEKKEEGGQLSQEQAMHYRRIFAEAFLKLNSTDYDPNVVGVQLGENVVLKPGIEQVEEKQRILQLEEAENFVKQFWEKTSNK